MNMQPLLDSSLYQSKLPFDIAAVGRLYGCNKVPATEIVQHFLDAGLLSKHYKRSENNHMSVCFCRYTADTKLLAMPWNSGDFYADSYKYQQHVPKWY